MTRLVENLLSIARADAGTERMNLQPIDLENFFRRIDRDWADSMRLARLNFHFEMHTEDHVVLGDPASLSRLLTILLENARKYTPPGGSVVLSAVSEGAGVRIAVQDTGAGILQKDLPRIFDRFFRGEQAGIAESSGSGLGLALGKWIAERHGTDLVVESAPGQGSSFSFTLFRAGPTSLKSGSFSNPTRNEEGIAV